MTVLVVGNATVDLSFEVERLPDPGETLLAGGRFVDAGGKGLNQAVMAKRAGADVRFVASVGTDPDAALIRARLAAEDIAADFLVAEDGATDQSIIWLAADGENVIVSTADRARSLVAEDAAAAFDGLGEGDLLLMQGNLTRAATEAVLRRAREMGLATLVNPAPIHFGYEGLWPLIDIAVVNRVEAQRLGGHADMAAAAESLLASGAGTVVVTLGSDGVLWFRRGGAGALSAPSVQAVDTTGAGDVFCGVLAGRLGPDRPLLEALPAAIEAAAFSVTRRGTSSAFPTMAELRGPGLDPLIDAATG